MRREFNVPIPRNFYMCWLVTTQSADLITVTLKDNSKTYFSQRKKSANIISPISCFHNLVQGDELKIVVDVQNSKQILGEPHSNDITMETGIVVGKEFNLCLDASTGKDYKDIAFSIVAWKIWS